MRDLTRSRRLAASFNELERCRVWQLRTVGRDEATGDQRLVDYVLGIVKDVWYPLSRLLTQWRRWSPWLKLPRWVTLEHYKNGRLPPGCGFWLVGYRARRAGGRYRHRKRVIPPPASRA